MAKAFGKRALDIALSMLDELLLLAKKQPSEPEVVPEAHPGLPKGARIIRSIQLTDLLHGGHSPAVNPEFEKEYLEARDRSEQAEPWQSSDGAIYLLNELCAISPKGAAKYLPQVAELTSVSGFHHADCLKETIYSCLPGIMKNLGKPLCKQNLELFYDELFKAIKGSRHGLASAARECVREIGKFIGPSILKGRLNEHRPEYAEEYESMLKSNT